MDLKMTGGPHKTKRKDEKPSASLIGLALVMRLSGVSSTSYDIMLDQKKG